MSKFKIEISQKAEKEFKNCDKKTQTIISRKILQLESGNFFGVTKLFVFDNFYRLRAGNFRIIFEFLPQKILKIVRIRHRDEKTYRDF